MSGVKVVPRVVEMFEAVCSRQFGNLGAYIKNSHKDLKLLSDHEGFVTTSIDAHSDELSILLHLSVPETFLRETMPTFDLEGGDLVQYQEDWCMELANRFLGDLKNQLLTQHCVMRMGLPKLHSNPISKIELHEDYEVIERLNEVDSHLLAQVHNLPIGYTLQIKLSNKDLVFSDEYEDADDEDCFDFEVGELEHL